MPTPNFIPQTDPYSIPTGFTTTTTPSGGTAYKDLTGNMYVRNAAGFQLFDPGIQKQISPVAQSVSIPAVTQPVDTRLLQNYNPQTINSTTIQPAQDLSKSIAYPPKETVPIVPVPNPQGIPAPSGKEYDAQGNLVDKGVPATGLSATQRDLQNRIEGVMGLNTSLQDESTFRAQQEQDAVLSEKAKVFSDLSNQLKISQLEAANIQAAPQPNQGVTSAIDARQRAEALRKNSVQSLQLYAQTQIAQGNYAAASDAVDRAVAAKYDPIKAKIDAAMKNLDLIIKSPQYTEDEKRRAQVQIDIQEKKKADATKKAEDASTIMSWAAPMLANGGQAAQLDIKELTKIATSENPDLNQAFQLYAKYASNPQATQKAIYDLEQQRLNLQKTKIEIGKLQAPSNSSVPTIKSINGVDVQWNPSTQKWESPTGVPNQPQSSYRSELATTGIQVIKGLREIAVANPGIFGRSAAAPIPDYLRSDDFRNYKAQLDALKGNIIPAALTAMREASKTGGALGQVSDREGAWLEASLGALSMSQTPKSVIDQLDQIKAHLTTWQNAVANNGGTNTEDTQVVNGVTYKKAADGLYYKE